MNPTDEKLVNDFAARVRQLIMALDTLRSENEELYQMVEEREDTIKALKTDVETWKQNYQNLKTARMINIADGEIDAAKARFSKLVREVDKCIALLNV